MKKIIKRLFKRGKYFIAALLILYMFLIGSISASASSLLYDEGYSVPAPADVSISWSPEAYLGSRYTSSGSLEFLELNYNYNADLMFSNLHPDAVTNNVDDDYFDGWDFYDTSVAIYYSDKINSQWAQSYFLRDYDAGLRTFYKANYIDNLEVYDEVSDTTLNLSSTGLTNVGDIGSSPYRGFVLLDNNIIVSASMAPFVGFNYINDLTDELEVYDFTIQFSNFSFWTDSSEQFTSNVAFYTPDFPAGISAISIVYSPYGSADKYTKFFYYSTVQDQGLNHLYNSMESSCLIPSPALFGLDDGYYYIHSMQVTFDTFTCYNDLNSSFNTIYYYNPKVWDEFTDALVFKPRLENPAVPLISYTTWLGTAVSGFLDLEILPYFSLGGIFMTLLAFTCVVWFLKLVAGG